MLACSVRWEVQGRVLPYCTPFSSYSVLFCFLVFSQRAKVKSYGTALASQGKKYYLGKYNKLLPPTEEGDLNS